jgi:hypothetical protein
LTTASTLSVLRSKMLMELSLALAMKPRPKSGAEVAPRTFIPSSVSGFEKSTPGATILPITLSVSASITSSCGPCEIKMCRLALSAPA